MVVDGTVVDAVVPTGADRVSVTAADGTRWSAVSYTHLRAHETVLDLVCRLLLEKKKTDRSVRDRYTI